MEGSETKHLSYHALVEVLDGDGCPFCSLVLSAMERYFSTVVYEQVNDIGMRAAWRASQGYCAAHGEMLRQARSALGSAIIHRDVVNTLVQALEGESLPENTPRSWLRGPRSWLRGLVDAGHRPRDRVLGGAEPCPACLRIYEREQNYIDTLLLNWDDELLQTKFRSSAGLCLSHLCLTLGRVKDAAQFDAIKAAHLAIWRDLIGELDEFIRKQDYRFADETIGAEGTSWSRAINLVSGTWQVAGSRRR
jgi:hypothetical protein